MAQGGTTRTQFQKELKKSLAKDDRDCRLLVDVYNGVKTCAEKSALVKDLVLQLEPDFFKHAEHGITDLKKVDRPILVIGESSSGKSSFLNLLIGRNVLPELAAPCTHCMCCIKKGSKLKARVSSIDGSKSSNTQIISADGKSDEDKSDEDFQSALKELVNGDNCEEALDRCIEIFVPSSILEGNVCLVDTPGFGETEQVTKSLVKYLPKAIGIIFILNSTVNAGIAEDRGVLILDEIKRLRKMGKIPSFDPTQIVFIGNKWDQIREKERKDHRLKMIEKLKKVWPHFQEDQLLHLSVIYSLRLQESTNSIPEDYKSAAKDYQAVLDRIRETVEHCGNARSQVHKRILFRVLLHMKTFVTLTMLSVVERQARVEELKGLLHDMESKCKTEREKIDSKVTDIQNTVVEGFHQYLNESENKQHIFHWNRSNTPNGTQFCDVKEKASVAIRAFITDAFSQRIVNSKPEIVDLTRMLMLLTSAMNIIRVQIEKVLRKPYSEASNPDEEITEELKFEQTDNELTGGDIVVLVLTAPLWIPLGLIAVVTVFPITSIRDMWINNTNMTKYRDNPRKYLDEWSKEIIINEFSKETLRKMTFQALTIHITKSLNDIEKTIETFKGLSDHFEKHVNEDKVPEGFDEIRDLCHRMNEKLNTTEQS